jgi:hypothetical protein
MDPRAFRAYVKSGIVLFIGLLLEGPCHAQTESQTRNYLALRDQYIKAAAVRFEAFGAKDQEIAKEQGSAAAQQLGNNADNELSAEDERELNELQQRLNQILGPFALEDFPQAGKINLETLYPVATPVVAASVKADLAITERNGSVTKWDAACSHVQSASFSCSLVACRARSRQRLAMSPAFALYPPPDLSLLQKEVLLRRW